MKHSQYSNNRMLAKITVLRHDPSKLFMCAVVV